MRVLNLGTFLRIVDDLEGFLLRALQRFLVTVLQLIRLFILIFRVVQLSLNQVMPFFYDSHDGLEQKNSQKNKENDDIEDDPECAHI